MKASLFVTFLALVQHVQSQPQCTAEDGVTIVSSTHTVANGCYIHSNVGGYSAFRQTKDDGAIIWPSDYFENGVDEAVWVISFENTPDDFVRCYTNSEPFGNPGNGGVEITTCESGESLPLEVSFSCGCTDHTCEFGIIKDNICCSAECGSCGGTGCGALPGGGSNCCGGPIVESGLSCDDGVAPCVIQPETDNDPTCKFGLEKDNICCPPECGTCGGSGCGSLPGGGSNCCGGPIVESGLSCDDNTAPCIIEPQAGDPDPTCERGIVGGGASFNNICCPFECGSTCGGVHCSLYNGGAANCCSASILASEVSCDEDEAPCIITVEPEPTASDPTCALGIIKDDICCHAECGICGGTGCGSRPGGASDCCAGSIRGDGLSCDDGYAPCVIGL